MHAVIIIILILAILLVIFTLQNSIEITISAFFWEISDAPLVLVLMVCVVVGYLLGAIYLYPQVWGLKKENKKLRRVNSKLKEKEEYVEKNRLETNPEGIELTDDNEENDDDDQSFFRE